MKIIELEQGSDRESYYYQKKIVEYIDILTSSTITLGMFMTDKFYGYKIKSIFYLTLFLSLIGSFHLSDKLIGNEKLFERMYIDGEEFSADTKGDAFYIHVGNNLWLETSTIHRDATGLFTYEYNITQSMKGNQKAYEKKWKCPYCHNFWPIGQPCGNAACPSKY